MGEIQLTRGKQTTQNRIQDSLITNQKAITKGFGGYNQQNPILRNEDNNFI